jgi:hypothetical protein
MTAFTDAGSSKVRNAKHLERPVESRMMVQASTLPNWVKYFLSDSGVTNLVLPILRETVHNRVPSVVSQFSPPMNILLHV